ncbi:hypothetical protein CA85_06530 [Allorhodopirellula solitaria]|uniref:Uncharacterized protein n=1 Tax=Allorhodopirellula solitaria TaxID=2527987 RepID=A0A5C5YKG6_9BACT|nr:hypothetical protein CA85_06530 [Allorhodopirellula solitaria]
MAWGAPRAHSTSPRVWAMLNDRHAVGGVATTGLP